MTVQVTAHVADLDKRRRLPAEGLLAQLGWTERNAERRVDA